MTDKDFIETYEEVVAECEATFDEFFDEDQELIELEGAVLSTALRNQVKLQLKWESLYREIESIYHTVDDECERIFSITFRELHGDSYKSLNYNEAKLYAMSDEDYVATKRLHTKIKSVKFKVESVLDVIKSRKFTLNNICDTMKGGYDGHII